MNHAVGNADVLVLKYMVDHTRPTCLFVTHSASCNAKPHVMHHVRSLVSAGCQVILAYNTDDMTFARRALSFALPDGIIVGAVALGPPDVHMGRVV